MLEENSKIEHVRIENQKSQEMESVNVMDEGKRVLRVEAQSILDLADRIDENFSRAVEILYDPSFFTRQKGPMEIVGC